MISLEKRSVLSGDHVIRFVAGKTDVNIEADTEEKTVNIQATGSIPVDDMDEFVEAVMLASDIASGKIVIKESKHEG